MPLPFILAGAAAAVAGLGAKKGYDGYQDKSEANDIMERAKNNYEAAEKAFKKSEAATESSLEELGQLQLNIGQDFHEFRTMAESLLKKIGDNSSAEINLNIPQHKLDQIKGVEISATDYLLKVGAAAVGGAAAAYAVYGGVMALGAASTGTSIAALSGAAAYNATMAAIGGGALSAGGLGMAGGAAILGGVVAAPVAAIAGLAYAKHGAEALANAKKIRFEVKEAVAKMSQSKQHLDKTKIYVDKIHAGLNDIYTVFKEYFSDLKAMDAYIRNRGDIDALKDPVIEVIKNGFSVASILAEIITTPLFKTKENNEENDTIEFETDENGMKIINEEVIDVVLVKTSYDIKKHQK